MNIKRGFHALAIVAFWVALSFGIFYILNKIDDSGDLPLILIVSFISVAVFLSGAYSK